MREVDGDVDAEAAIVRRQFAVGIALLHADRLENLGEAARRGQRHDPGLIDRLDERRRAAVHDRRFGTVDLDDGVVDAEAAQRRHDVFDGGDARAALVVAQNGREFGRGHVAGVGADLALRPALRIEAHEHDAGAGISRMQCQWRPEVRNERRSPRLSRAPQAWFACPLS